MNNYEETVVAVVDPLIRSGENELAVQVFGIESRAEEMIVDNDQQYAEAGELGAMLKQKIAEVAEFFAPMKKSAHDAHKQVCDREKQMLSPLKNAESILKKNMGAYALKKEEERRAAEDAARCLAQEEADKRLAMAIEAEKNGDSNAANAAMLDAEIADSVARTAVVESETLKAKGVSVQKDWEITDIEPDKVPISIAGINIRPVDTAAVMKLIRASKGAINIEGITYREKAKMSFRRS